MKTVYKVLDYMFDEVDLGDYEAESRYEAKKMAAEKHYTSEKYNAWYKEDPESAISLLTTRYISGYRDDTKTIRCTQCATEFSDIEAESIKLKCPACGNKGLPMAISDDVNVKINWHELRILSIWAENWARQIKDEMPGAPLTIMCIADRLQKQYPDKNKLTLFSEIRDLRKNHEIVTDIDDDAHLGLS